MSENSPFLYEGKNVLIEEFGKEYGMYFSILELIATGKTSRSEIDLVALNDLKKRIVIAEIKLNNLGALKVKAESLLKHYPGYTPEYLALSLEDAERFNI